MRKRIIPISVAIACLSVSYTSIPPVQANNNSMDVVVSNSSSPYSTVTADISGKVYDNINLQQYGLSKEAFNYAWKGYQRLLQMKLISRSDYLTICDFSQSSKQKRFYLIDLTNKKLVINTYVAHGRNSGGEYATQFSNNPESLQSSLGFYITRSTYIGEHGLSLKIEGVDAGYNDKASQRNIVIHGAAYIDDGWLRHCPCMGRSYGCPAVPLKESTTIINTIKNGTCLFIYHPAKNYLLGSKILNG